MQAVAGILKQDVAFFPRVGVMKHPEQRNPIAAPHAPADGILVPAGDREHAEAMEWTPPPDGTDLCQCGVVVEPP